MECDERVVEPDDEHQKRENYGQGESYYARKEGAVHAERTAKGYPFKARRKPYGEGDDGGADKAEEVEVEYNTPISEVVPETRNSEGQAVLSWSKTSSGDQIFTGNITDDTVLYAVEWAPVIELDLNGGEGKNAVVAREGATVALPTPVRENYKFLYWETMSGEEANITKMPADGAQLKAVWQAMLVFDENGGTEVNDISQEAGTAITLPTPEKEGFIFAGWYNASKDQYTSTTMPTTSVELKAGWYKSRTETIIVKKDSNSEDDWVYCYNTDTTPRGPKADWRTEINLAEFLPENGSTVSISISYDMKTNDTRYDWEAGIYLYDDAVISDVNFLKNKIDTIPSNTSWRTYTFDTTFTMKSNT